MTEPSVKLPLDARNRLAEEIAQIRRTIKGAWLKAQAVDHAIQKIKDQFPDAFHKDSPV